MKVKRLLVLSCCLLCISSCASKKTELAKPVSRPSQKPYTVMGQRYEPLDTHEGFEQEGVASWYGRDFHGKKTSNGEIYDMHALTAAHKTLPLGIHVRVRSLDNGREIVVRVNDRGPFVKNRVIDLSYAAARKLGIDIAGTGRVRVEALGFREGGTDRYRPLAAYDAGTFTVQVGAFKDFGNAQRLSNEMRKVSGFSEVRTANVYGEKFHRVYAGKYTSLKAAERAERDFAESGYPGSFTVALE